MRKLVLMLVLVIVFPVSALFAQRDIAMNPTSEFYFLRVPIERIYVYHLGYIVVYRAGWRQVYALIPHEWFTSTGGNRAERVGITSANEWPSMTVFYHQGEFSHVRLRVRRNRDHQTWRFMRQSNEIDEMFRDVTEVRLEF